MTPTILWLITIPFCLAWVYWCFTRKTHWAYETSIHFTPKTKGDVVASVILAFLPLANVVMVVYQIVIDVDFRVIDEFLNEPLNPK